MSYELLTVGSLTAINGFILWQMKKVFSDMRDIKKSFEKYETRFVNMEKEIIQLKNKDKENNKDLISCQAISKQNDVFIQDRLIKIGSQVDALFNKFDEMVKMQMKKGF